MASAGGRTLIVRDTSGLGFINQRTLKAVTDLSSVQTAVAVGLTFDATNGRIGPGGTLVSTWPISGDLTTAVRLLAGRWPQPGEALITATAQTDLGLVAPSGYLVHGHDQYPIVGEYAPLDGFEDMSGAVINDSFASPAGQLRVVIASISQAGSTQSAVLGILAPADAGGVSITSPLGLSQLSQAVDGQLAGAGRSLMLMILGVGGLFVAVVVLADVLIRRRDLGRRRTLGITRADLTCLVTFRAAAAALVGAIIGSGVGMIACTRIGQVPGVDFGAAVAIMATLTAAIAAVIPAAWAAQLDPVQVMRTP